MSDHCWEDLPEYMLAHIFSFVPFVDRINVMLVCDNWKQSLESPSVWKVVNCSFFHSHHHEQLSLFRNYGHYIKHLSIFLNQSCALNRENALTAIHLLANSIKIDLISLKISFKGTNPCFYSGREFFSSLSALFQKIREHGSKLETLNLSELCIDLTNEFITEICTNCPGLKYLNILNQMLVCNITPYYIKTLVENCRHLQVLHVYHTNLSDEVFHSLCNSNRSSLQRLGIVCRREVKYVNDLSSEAWSELVNKNPGLKVELGFDNTCPLDRVAEIMKPEIPVVDLHLTTFTTIFSEINTACSFYSHSLVKVVVQTRPSLELDDALLNLARRCHKLQSLLVYCVVDKEVIDEILNLHPVMKGKGSYILKSEVEPEPWTVGEEEDEI